MSAWVEIFVAGGHRAVIAADTVAGVVCPKGGGLHDIGTETASLTIILRGGETLPPVIGITAGDLIARCDAIRQLAKLRGTPYALIATADDPENLWAALDAAHIAAGLA